MQTNLASPSYIRFLNRNQNISIHRIYNKPNMPLTSRERLNRPIIIVTSPLVKRTRSISISATRVYSKNKLPKINAKWANLLWKNKGENIRIRDAIKMGRMYESLASQYGRRSSQEELISEMRKCKQRMGIMM